MNAELDFICVGALLENGTHLGVPPERVLGIAWAVRSTSITGVSDKHIKRYIDNLDHIKKLYDNRPSKRIVYWTVVNENLDWDIYAHCRVKYYTIFGYDEQKMNDRIQHERNEWGFGPLHKFENLKEI